MREPSWLQRGAMSQPCPCAVATLGGSALSPGGGACLQPHSASEISPSKPSRQALLSNRALQQRVPLLWRHQFALHYHFAHTSMLLFGLLHNLRRRVVADDRVQQRRESHASLQEVGRGSAVCGDPMPSH